MPDGKKRTVTMEHPGEWMAHELISEGWNFEIEILQTGHVSMEVCRDDRDEHETLANELCLNGPEVVKSVDRLIQNAYQKYEISIIQ